STARGSTQSHRPQPVSDRCKERLVDGSHLTLTVRDPGIGRNRIDRHYCARSAILMAPSVITNLTGSDIRILNVASRVEPKRRHNTRVRYCPTRPELTQRSALQVRPLSLEYCNMIWGLLPWPVWRPTPVSISRYTREIRTRLKFERMCRVITSRIMIWPLSVN